MDCYHKYSRTAIKQTRKISGELFLRHQEENMNRIHDTKELGRAIRARRRELGYTQAFLAEYAGVSASFLSELENGKETIQLGKMMEVLSLLGMDICMSRRGE